jgi:hypothetical protein
MSTTAIIFLVVVGVFISMSVAVWVALWPPKKTARNDFPTASITGARRAGTCAHEKARSTEADRAHSCEKKIAASPWRDLNGSRSDATAARIHDIRQQKYCQTFSGD